MKLLVLCLLFGAVLALTRADPPEDKPNNEVEDPEIDDNDTAEPESVDETELTEEPESVDETELSEAEDEESGERAKRCLKICRPGTWCRRGRRRYKYYTYRYDWSQAQRHCQRSGATLATVHNRAADNFLRSLAQGREAWIGMSDAANERQWLWINGDRQVYTNFCHRQPDNAGGRQDCAVINWLNRRKCWDDQSCNTRLPFICEKRKYRKF